MNKLYKIIVVSLFLFPAINVFGQKQFDLHNLYLEGRYHYGFIAPHHKSIAYNLEDHIRGFEIAVSQQTFGKNIYEKMYRYPRIGIGLTHTSLGNDDVYGNATAIYSIFDVSIYHRNKLSVNYQIGFGISHLSKVFNAETNPMNIAMSARNNVYAGFDINVRYNFYKNIELKGGIDLTHFSNGKLRSPNFGLNLATSSIGLVYNFNKDEKKIVVPERPEINEKNKYDIIFSAGARTFDDLYNDYYFMSSLVFEYQRQVHLKYSIGGGADIFYNQELDLNYMNSDSIQVSGIKRFQMGAHISMNTIYNRLLLTMQIGYYVYAKYLNNTPIYNRIGFRYFIGEHLILNLALKTHFSVAEFIEWGVGYRL